MARTGQPRPRRRRESGPAGSPPAGALPPAPPSLPDARAVTPGPDARAGGTAGETGERPWRRGVRLGVDVGSVRVGLAACDHDGLVATAVETLARELPAPRPARGRAGAGRSTPRPDPAVLPADVARLAAEVRERGAVEVVVGLPRSLSGDEGRAASAARQYAGRLADVVAPVPVRLVDERLSTAGAHRALHEGGTSGRRHRAVVDQVAAAWILQTALDLERSSGRPPGSLARPLAPDGRRRDRSPVPEVGTGRDPQQRDPDDAAGDQHEADAHEGDQQGQDDEVGSRAGAQRTGEDAQARTSGPRAEEATVSTTPHPVPRPPRRPVPPPAGAEGAEGRR